MPSKQKQRVKLRRGCGFFGDVFDKVMRAGAKLKRLENPEMAPWLDDYVAMKGREDGQKLDALVGKIGETYDRYVGHPIYNAARSGWSGFKRLFGGRRKHKRSHF